MTGLAGIRVLDFSWAQAGPVGTLLLSDLGAEVWKVERPEGDMTRQVEADGDGRSWVFDTLNRGKRSVVLDLRDPAAAAAVLGVVGEFDVVVENLKPGAMARLGFSADRLMEANPRLIYASCSGFGQDEAGTLPAFDLVIQALSGLMMATGYEGSPPVRVPFSCSDVGAGMFLAIAVLGALVERATTGRGSRVDVSMIESQLFMMWELVTRHLVTGRDEPRIGSRISLAAPYQAFPTATGDVVVAVGTDQQFARLCDALDVAELARDPRFAMAAARVRNVDALEALLAPVLRSLPRDEVVRRVQGVQVPCAPVNRVGDAVRSTPFVEGLALDVVGGRPVLSTPIRRNGTRMARTTAAPLLGADGDALLSVGVGEP